MGILDAPGVARSSIAISGTRFMPIGDSITYLDAGNLSDSPLLPVTTAYRGGAKATGMFGWANAQLGHRLKMAGNGGVPGDTTTQILARLDGLLAVPSDIVSVLGGANDFSQSFTAAQTIANLTTIYGKIRATGRRLVVLTTMSRSTMNTTAGYTYLNTVNQFIKDYARKNPGVILADICSVMTDPATGTPYNTGTFYTSDGTHPNAIGAQAMGKVIADALRPFVPASDVFSSNNLDPLNVMRNACNTGTGGTVANGITGTPGTQWAFTATGTAVAAVSKVARTDGLPGEWTRLVIDPTNTAAIVASGACYFGSASGYPDVGSTITTAIEVRTTGLVGVSLFQGGNYHPNSQAAALAGGWQQGSGKVNDGTYTLMVDGHVIQAGATYQQARVAITATGGTLDIGRCAMFKTP